MNEYHTDYQFQLSTMDNKPSKDDKPDIWTLVIVISVLVILSFGAALIFL